jgi:hypothetical protein
MNPLLLPATPPPDAPLTPEGEAALAAARPLLDRSARVLLSDGRLVVGRFYCLDREGNVVLVDAFTQSPAKPTQAGAGTGTGAGAGAGAGAGDEAEIALGEEGGVASSAASLLASAVGTKRAREAAPDADASEIALGDEEGERGGAPA